jgi:hypothetical protein
MKKSLLAGIGLVALVVLPAVAVHAQDATATPWIHVRVEEPEKQSKVAVNLPLSVVEVALEAAPEMIESHGNVHLGEKHGMKLADLRRVWAELAAVGDAELVTVENKDETVKVWRKADQVHVRVEKQGKEEVVVEVPVSLVDALLSGEGDKVNIKAAIAELQKKRGDIVTVTEPDTTVRIWIDEQNAQ